MLTLDLFKYNSRLKVVTFAIGVCVAFIVGSFAFANGLSSTVKLISDRFDNEGAVAFKGYDLGNSILSPGDINVGLSFASVGMCRAEINGTEMVFFAVKDPSSLFDADLVPDEGEMLSGQIAPMNGHFTISNENGSVELHANKTYSSTMFPGFWHLLRWSDLETLRPNMVSNVSFVIFSSLGSDSISQLESQGLVVIEMTAILTYFNAGSEEVTSDLWLIIVPASFIVALLVYSAVGMELKDREREIAILKAMGASNRQIGKIFLFQALVLSILGGLVGIMIGIIVSYAISTSSSIVITNSLFFLKVTEFSMMVAFICALASGIAGSALPIFRVSKKSVREAIKK